MEGAPHMAKRFSVVPLGAPLPTYIKEGGRRRPTRGGAPKRGGGSPTPSRIRPPPLSYFHKEKAEGEGEEKERGGLALVQFGLG